MDLNTTWQKISSKSPKYKSLNSQERDDDNDSQEPLAFTSRSTIRMSKWLAIVLLLCNTLLFAASLYVLWIAMTGRSAPSDLECAKRVSPWSPIWDAVEFWEDGFDYNFTKPSMFRGRPTLELERAWDSILQARGIAVSEEGLAKMNKPNHGRYVPTEGSDPNQPTYGGSIEVLHQLHCLNFVRQATWPLEMYDKAWGKFYPTDLEDPVEGRKHIEHCIETLRMTLMCYADVTPVMLMYDDKTDGRLSDFAGTPHKCRNFEKIIDYLDIHGADVVSS